jgi:phosphoribosylaminoimidazole-succinocarboxamide synthase
MPSPDFLPLPELKLLHSGKVRDVYAIDDDTLFIVASDRLSAFDVILPDPIPGKGEILTQMSNFWFAKTEAICPNHLLDQTASWPKSVDRALYGPRSVLCKRLKALPVEAIARGYLLGTAYKSYQKGGEVCGLQLPAGLRLAEQLNEPIFTPSTKAAVGDHDENIGFDQMVALIGGDLAERVRAATLAIYRFAANHAAARGVLIADTKLEFGLDQSGQLLVMDEMLTPDSSRFWRASSYQVGTNPESFDKQFARDYLESCGWNKAPPAPHLPVEIIAGTKARYLEALTLLT